MPKGRHKSKDKKMICMTTTLTNFSYKKSYELEDKLGDLLALKNNEGKLEWVAKKFFEKG